MTILYLDLETYSTQDLPRVGGYKYAHDCEVMLFAWALDDYPVRVEDLTQQTELSGPLRVALDLPGVELCAHHSMFDRTVLNHSRNVRYPTTSDRWHDTMVQALAHSLPAGLGALCDVLRIDADRAKDKDGRALLNLFCKPDKTGGRNTRFTHPEKWDKFVRYAALDIEAMRACRKKMPRWNYAAGTREMALWNLDQTINDRGICVDVDLATAALACVTEEQAALAVQTHDLTDGRVASATKRAQLLKEILDVHGVSLPDLQKSTLETRVNDESLPEGVRELLRIRLQASTSSTSKYKTLLACQVDSRLHGTKQFCGADRTGRWAGRLWQPDNLPRPDMTPDEITRVIESIKLGTLAINEDNVMRASSNAIRGCIVAPPGKKLVVADLSNIEGRVQAWLAGETWKLDAFRRYDAGTGADLYKLAYAGSFGVDPADVTKDQRQVGKVQELALGYEGGVTAFVTFALVYGIDLDEMADRAQAHIPPAIWGQAAIMLKWHRDHKRDPLANTGLCEKTWLVCESFVLGWRQAHPQIKWMWKVLQQAARSAVEQSGKVFNCGQHLSVRRDGAWLRVMLPSGRSLCYPSPSVRHQGDPCGVCEGTGDVQVDGFALTCHACEGSGLTKSSSGSLSYFGMNRYTRRWQKQHTYGGKLFENVCQAVARDVMGHNMPPIEGAGYALVLTVHDEVVTEAPEDRSADLLSSLLASSPPWAPGLPLAAAGFEADRYKKDA